MIVGLKAFCDKNLKLPKNHLLYVKIVVDKLVITLLNYQNTLTSSKNFSPVFTKLL